MKYIAYMLLHGYKNSYAGYKYIEMKMVGIYDSEENAKNIGIKKSINLPGFRDYPNDFHIIKFILDKARYKKGFTKIRGEKLPRNDKVSVDDLPIENKGLLYAYHLTHFYKYDKETHFDDIRELGIFSSKYKAEQIINEFKNKPGFIDHKGGFCIAEYKLNENEWTSGFAKDYD